jgi:hypothetical protein
LVSLLIVVLLFFSLDNSSPKIKYSSNSVHIQTINYPSKITSCEVIKIPYTIYVTKPAYTKTTQLFSEKLSYEDSSRDYIQESFFSDVQVYEVTIKNTGCKGGYFKVEYNFKTVCGEEKTEYIREYIPYEKEKTFTYKNLDGERQEISSWNYKVISETESCSSSSLEIVPEKVVKETRYKDEVICKKI